MEMNLDYGTFLDCLNQVVRICAIILRPFFIAADILALFSDLSRVKFIRVCSP